ncbi:MAG: hypothetical protein ACAH83_07865 [Alphaproteobacteria bacterium]
MTGNSFKKYFAPQAFTLCFALLVSWGAVAGQIDAASDTTPGCERKVLDAMSAKANARVAYDVATTEQIVDKPDSILAMTCFNNAAGSAALLGQMFGGDFTTPLSKIVPDSLTAFYDDYQLADGYDTGTVDYTQTALGTSISTCDFMQLEWDQLKQEGIQKNIPYPKYSDFVTGTAPNGVTTVLGGSNFEKDWNQAAADNDFGSVSSAITALPIANTPTTILASPVNTDTECDVMVKIGVYGGPCPMP